MRIMLCRQLRRSVPSLTHIRQLSAMSSAPEITAVMRRIEQGDLPWGSVFTDKMLTMQWSKQHGWAAPQLKPYGPIPLPPSAAVFHYAMEVFEGLKAYKQPSTNPPLHSPNPANHHIRMFRPQLNIARLNHSATRLALPTVDENAFLSTLSEYVSQQSEWVPSTPGSSLYLRPCIISTDSKIGVSRSNSALLFVIASPVSSFFPKTTENQRQYQKGVSLLANPKYVRAWKGGVGDCKTGGNYAASVAPAEEAKAEGFDQILWLSDEEKQLVTEVGMMNVFFVFHDHETGRKRLVTPRLDGTILDGITRRSILELAPEMNIPAEERDISIQEVSDAVDDGRIVEIFGSGTAAVVCPVHKITTPDRVVTVKQKEASGDLSVLFRERLVEIHTSADAHPWMVPITASNWNKSKAFDTPEGECAVADTGFEQNKDSQMATTG